MVLPAFCCSQGECLLLGFLDALGRDMIQWPWMALGLAISVDFWVLSTVWTTRPCTIEGLHRHVHPQAEAKVEKKDKAPYIIIYRDTHWFLICNKANIIQFQLCHVGDCLQHIQYI